MWLFCFVFSGIDEVDVQGTFFVTVTDPIKGGLAAFRVCPHFVPFFSSTVLSLPFGFLLVLRGASALSLLFLDFCSIVS